MIGLELEPLEPEDLRLKHEKFPWIEVAAIATMLALVVFI